MARRILQGNNSFRKSSACIASSKRPTGRDPFPDVIVGALIAALLMGIFILLNLMC
jgi:hypothetical protein